MEISKSVMSALQTINIKVEGSEMEVVTLSLDEAQVSALYTENKSQKAKIVELEKKLKDTEQYKEMYSKKADEKQTEVDGANILLSALGVQEKDNNENDYYRKPLPVATRIALYIANAVKKD